MSSEKKEKVSVIGSGPDQITIGGLTPQDKELLEGMINSNSWASVIGGRIVSHNRFEDLPDPIIDEEMFPFWRSVNPKEYGSQLEFKSFERLSEYSFPSIIIQDLCGYDYSPENYKKEGEKLKSYGFSIMRSQRGDDGKYWEIWFLLGLYLAKGDLLNEIKSLKAINDRQRLKKALDFLRRNVKFGTLDVCVQKLAMVIQD